MERREGAKGAGARPLGGPGVPPARPGSARALWRKGPAPSGRSIHSASLVAPYSPT